MLYTEKLARIEREAYTAPATTDNSDEEPRFFTRPHFTTDALIFLLLNSHQPQRNAKECSVYHAN